MLTRIAPFLFVLLWSSGFIGARFGLSYAEPGTFLAIRMIANIAVFVLLIALIKAVLPKGKEKLHSMISGLLIHGFYLGGTYQAISAGMPAGLCALLVGLQPILTAVIMSFNGTAKLKVSQWAGLFIGFAGISLVLRGNMEWQQTGQEVFAYVCTILALLGITVGTLYQKKYCQSTDMVGGTLYQYLASAVLFILIATTTETMQVEWTQTFSLTLAWLVFVLSLVAVLLLMYMVKHGESSKVASTFYLVPPVTAVQAWLAFDETFNLYGLVGFILAAIAVYLVTRKPTITKETEQQMA